jgi:RNA-directed DNA polymerase
MRITKVPKGNGKFRTIYCPSHNEKYDLTRLVPSLNHMALEIDTHKVAHGFMPGRSIITNALAHVGDWKITLHFDFEDFFDSVTPDHCQEVPKRAAQHHEFRRRTSAWNIAFPDGAARQGLPTSPALANIAAAPFDAALIALRDTLTPKRRLLGSRGPAFVYTRYADDLSFSCNSESVATRIQQEIPALAARFGFKINPAKTTRQHAAAGLRTITGIAVTPTGIRPTRRARRKLRAATHQLQCGIRRRNLRKMLTKQTESYHRDDPYTLHRLGDILRAQWRGLAAFIRLIPPKNPTTAQPTHTQSQQPIPAHTAAPPITMPFGIFNRKITA